MKTTFQFLMAASLTLTVSLTNAQESKKYKIYLDVDKNGEKSVIDTTFETMDEMKAYLKTRGLESPADITLPEMPGLNGFEFEFQFDDEELTPEIKEKIQKEMDRAKVQMKKAKAEMKDGEKEFKKARVSMQKAKDEHEKVNVEINESESPGKRIVIKKFRAGDETGESKVIIIDGEESTDDVKDMMFVKVYCDSMVSDDAKVKIIRKIKEVETGEDLIWEEKTDVNTENEPASNTNEFQWEGEQIDAPESMSQLNEAPSGQTLQDDTDYRMNVSDFTLYPNPTLGKITISFKVEDSSPVHVRLLDTGGKEIVNELVPVHDGTFNKEYSIENKSRGTYLMQLKQGNKWRHEKVVVK